jgi:hypothetical protein
MATIGGLTIPMLPDVPRANWSIGTRKDTRYFTVHYNGPKVPGFGYPKLEADQMRSDARYHMRAGALGAKSGGDGIQYHGYTDSSGANYMLREVTALLWHCRNFEGNSFSISWHLPLGGDQSPTAAQAYSLEVVIDAFRREYPKIAVTGVKGHKEWALTSCPGNVMPLVFDYRNSHTYGKPIQYYVTTVNANCRTAPDISAPIALNGTAITPANTTFGVDAVVTGKPYQGDPFWVHRADGIGFYHMSVVHSLTAKAYLPL